MILHKQGTLSNKHLQDIIHIWDMYHNVLHIFAIAKLDILNMEATSRKIKEHLCAMMQIDNFTDAEDYLNMTYQKIIQIYQEILAVRY